jgi:hypothetical protein
MRNTCRNVWYTLDGKTQVIRDWANQTGIDQMTLKGRIARGWPLRKALTMPPLAVGRPRKKSQTVKGVPQ